MYDHIYEEHDSFYDIGVHFSDELALDEHEYQSEDDWNMIDEMLFEREERQLEAEQDAIEKPYSRLPKQASLRRSLRDVHGKLPMLRDRSEQERRSEQQREIEERIPLRQESWKFWNYEASERVEKLRAKISAKRKVMNELSAEINPRIRHLYLGYTPIQNLRRSIKNYAEDIAIDRENLEYELERLNPTLPKFVNERRRRPNPRFEKRRKHRRTTLAA